MLFFLFIFILVRSCFEVRVEPQLVHNQTKNSRKNKMVLRTSFSYFIVSIPLLAFSISFIETEGAEVETKNSSHENHSSVKLVHKVVCAEETFVSTRYGDFTFPETEAVEHGNEVKVKCPFGFRNDGYQSIYGDITTKESKEALSGATRSCFLVNEGGEVRAEWRPSLQETQIVHCKRKGWYEQLVSWNNTLATVTPATSRRIWVAIGSLQDYALDDYDCAVPLINGLAYLLTAPLLNGDNGMSQIDRERILDRVEEFMTDLRYKLEPGFKLQVGDAGIVLETAVFYGVQYYARAKRSHQFTKKIHTVKSYETRLAPVDDTNVFIGISAEAVNMAVDQTSTDPQLKITAYNNEILKSWNESMQKTRSQLCTRQLTSRYLNNKNSVIDSADISIHNATSNDNVTDPYTTWGLLCIELNGNIANLTEPVEFTILNNSHTLDGHKLKCVYWDDDEEIWSSEGVTSVQLENGVKCISTHLTAFSALIEPLPLPFPGAEYAPINNSIHSYILSILSSIGSVCSIIGLSFTLLTYGLFRSLRRERSNRILINLSTSLLLLHIMSVSGSKSLWDGYCFFPSISLHYLVLTSLAWMMVEAVHMFELLISVFVRPETRFLIKRIVLAWGLPLIIVVICGILEPQVYQLGRADLCLMNAHENIYLYYGAYIGPIFIMLLVNFVIFVRIFRVFYQQTKRSVNQGQGTVPKYYLIKVSPSQIKGATSVLVLLGIGWILGLLAMGPFEVLFRYMYCVCNAGQGLLIFIFRVVLNPQACKQWKMVIVGFSPDNSLDVSTTTSSSGSGKKRFKRKSTIISPTFLSASNSVENSLTASNPLSTKLATTLAAILKAENDRVANLQLQDMN